MQKIIEQQLADYSKAYSKVNYPSKVSLAVTQKPDGSYNLITLEWFMRTSIMPPMLAISIGHSRYSYDCLMDVRYFNLVIPSSDQKDLVKFCGSNSGRDIDKFSAQGVEYISGKLAKLPVLLRSAANFECEIVNQVISGDHTIFVGEVKYSWLNASGTDPYIIVK